MFTIVVHGGAGRVDEDRREACTRACEAGAKAGLEILAAGGHAMDAVQAAVRALEDEPELNAGVGSALSEAGTVEVDAAIMDGATRRYGAVCAVPELRRPIDAARAILDDGTHAILAGEKAWGWLADRGLERDTQGAMITARARSRLASTLAERGPPPEGGGTVGACAIDSAGRLAAATSTGGITGKRLGRVGDSPLPGSGTWATLGGAASATGTGEAILRVGLTRSLVDRLHMSSTPDHAGRAALAELAEITGATAGVIALDAAGRPGIVHTTPEMPWAEGDASGLRAGWRR
jgi:beta-aspartyl-peptidase (threonine type)